MAQIKLRRMTDAARQNITFAAGEPCWTTDTKKLWMGDGATAGGIAVDTTGGAAVTVENVLTSTSTSNALSAAQGKTLKNHLDSKANADMSNVTGGFPESIVEQLKNAVLSSIGDGAGDDLYLINTPAITGSSTAAAGSTVTLTATIPTYLWGGSAGITVKWLMEDGSIQTGLSIQLQTPNAVGGEKRVECYAVADGNPGIASGKRLHILSASTNATPSADGVISNLPATLTKGSAYTVVLSGASDTDSGDTLTYVLSGLVGSSANISETSGSFILTVDMAATSVGFDVRVRDNKGAQSSTVKTFSRSSANVVQPTGTSGMLGEGSHTVVVPIGVSTVTLTGNGGGGLAYIACTPQYQTYCDGDSGCYTTQIGCTGGQSPAAGNSTTVNGAIAHTFGGATSGNAGAPAATQAVYQVPVGTSKTLTISVANRGGSCKVDW